MKEQTELVQLTYRSNDRGLNDLLNIEVLVKKLQNTSNLHQELSHVTNPD